MFGGDFFTSTEFAGLEEQITLGPRPPAGPTSSIPILFGCNDPISYTTQSLLLPKWNNTTKVTDYAGSGSWQSGGIIPYQRPATTAGGCYIPPQEQTPPVCCSDDCVTVVNGFGCGSPGCDLPTTCSFASCPSGSETFYQGDNWNCYQTSSAVQNFAVCGTGKKNMYANKNWHGILPYTSTDRADAPPSSFNWCGICDYIPNHPTPETTRYLRIDSTAAYNIVGGDGSTLATATATGSAIVDRYSGVMTCTMVSSSACSTYPDEEGFYAELVVAAIIGAQSITSNTALLNYQNYVGLIVGPPVSTNPDITRQLGPASYYLEWDGLGDYTQSAAISMSPASCTFDTTNSDPITEAFGASSLTITPTSILQTNNGYVTSSLFNGESNNSFVSISLSVPYTSTELADDVVGLLTSVDLGNDLIWPYRTDTSVGGPLLHYDENSATAPLLQSAGVYGSWTGEILGKPHPYQGANFWDGNHQNWEVLTCDTDEGPITTLDLVSYGAWSNYSPFATCWTNLQQETYILGQGAQYIFVIPDLQLWASDYCEMLEDQVPSYNFARPCGAYDRFMISGSAICVDLSASTGSNIVLASPSPYSGNYTASIYGGVGSYPGIYIVNGNGTANVTIITELLSGSYFPTDLYGYDGGTSGGMTPWLAPLRWCNTTSPICGTVPITAISGSVITLASDQPGIIAGDTLSITGSNVGIDGSWELTRINSTQFSIDTIATTSSYYNGKAYLYNPSGSAAIWNDDKPKGDYITVEWHYNNRDIGEWSRLTNQSSSLGVECNGVTPCGNNPTVGVEPRLAQASNGVSANIDYISCHQYGKAVKQCYTNVIALINTPLSSSFQNANFGSFQYTPDEVVDSVYGGTYIQSVVQYMTDPLDPQSPPCPCKPITVDSFTAYECDPQYSWKMDNGSCQNDVEAIADINPGLEYYRQQDYFEARCSTLPQGAPPMPPGYSMGCCNTHDLNNTASVLSCNICLPPFNDGQDVYTPWTIQEARALCCAKGGRFLDYYESDGTFCNSFVEEDI